MSHKCIHLSTTKPKIVQPEGEIITASFICVLKRENREVLETINDAYRSETQVSVAGYTCYYYKNKIAKAVNCLKYKEAI
jgi:hypothetical protein